MMISLLSDFDSRYASRISEYVMPPATNTSIRWRVSFCVPAPLVALCQLGFWLRSDTAGCICGADRRLLVAGAADGAQLVEAMKGMSWESPRGPVSIDPRTREMTQNIYVRRVERVGGELFNVEFDTFRAVSDPAKNRAG